MLRLAFDFIITWRETRTRPNAYSPYKNSNRPSSCIMTLSAKLTPTEKTDKPFRGGYRRIRHYKLLINNNMP